jgi:hypothetical protein
MFDICKICQNWRHSKPNYDELPQTTLPKSVIDSIKSNGGWAVGFSKSMPKAIVDVLENRDGLIAYVQSGRRAYEIPKQVSYVLASRGGWVADIYRDFRIRSKKYHSSRFEVARALSKTGAWSSGFGHEVPDSLTHWLDRNGGFLLYSAFDTQGYSILTKIVDIVDGNGGLIANVSEIDIPKELVEASIRGGVIYTYPIKRRKHVF